MTSTLPDDWMPWRSASSLGGGRPGKADLAQAVRQVPGRQDVLPYPSDTQCAGLLRLLVVGINPSPWTAAVNAPFARPGNRFWPSLALAGITQSVVDASCGLSPMDERLLARLGIGIINLVARPTARADQLDPDELRAGAEHLVERVGVLGPTTVAVVGITAFRTAFAVPKAACGPQDTSVIDGWPTDVRLWVLPNPSGLNAHETVHSLGHRWRAVWAAATETSSPTVVSS